VSLVAAFWLSGFLALDLFAVDEFPPISLGEAQDRLRDMERVMEARFRHVPGHDAFEATTASYSAEWARALCRHAVEYPPPVFPERTLPLPEEEHGEGVEELKEWLEPVLDYWKPEVPWERLLRPSMYNKAKEGAGATLAGIEVLGEAEEAGVRFRAWALDHTRVSKCRSRYFGTQVSQFARVISGERRCSFASISARKAFALAVSFGSSARSPVDR
jgi:hypothetical protein